MTVAAMLMKEIETLPEESAFEVSKPRRVSIEDAHGIFRDLKGMDTTIEREEDRV
jgi:hypothetical protein